MKPTAPFVLLACCAVLLLAGCAAGPNELAGTVAANGEVAGFWLGLWHGMIAPFAFIVSLFNESVHIYEVHNNGALYNLGFILGAAFLLGGGSSASGGKKR